MREAQRCFCLCIGLGLAACALIFTKSAHAWQAPHDSLTSMRRANEAWRARPRASPRSSALTATPEQLCDGDACKRHGAQCAQLRAPRRSWVGKIPAALLAAVALSLNSPANAELVEFPPQRPLRNRYFILRAGQSVMDQNQVIFTNPVLKTSMENSLTIEGRHQIEDVAEKLASNGVTGPWVYYSISASTSETAEMLRELLGIERSRLVPEYSFLDARGLGGMNGLNTSLIADVYTQDSQSRLNRPPAGQDGTPNESVEDLFVRVRQLLSILETQYSAEDVLIVAPDSDTLSVLQSALFGVPLEQHSRYYMAPGECRTLTDSRGIPWIVDENGKRVRFKFSSWEDF